MDPGGLGIREAERLTVLVDPDAGGGARYFEAFGAWGFVLAGGEAALLLGPLCVKLGADFKGRLGEQGLGRRPHPRGPAVGPGHWLLVAPGGVGGERHPARSSPDAP